MSNLNTLNRERLQKIDEDEFVIDIVALIKELIRHWYLILILTVLFGGVAYGYCKYMVTPMYQSTSEMLVLSKSTDSTSLSDLQIGSNLAEDYKVVVVGRPVIDQVAENLKLNMSYGKLKEKISVRTISDRIIAITVTDADPKKAKMIADETAKVSSTFIQKVLKQNKPSIIQEGYTDGNPVSPRTKRMSAFAAAAGFLLACIIIMIKFFMNDTIKNVEELETKLGVNILGQLPYEEKMFGKAVNRKKK